MLFQDLPDPDGPIDFSFSSSCVPRLSIMKRKKGGCILLIRKKN